VSLKVFDMLGREAATLVSQELPSGTYETRFDRSSLGGAVSAKGGYASGMYFYCLSVSDPSGHAETFTETRKMILLK
jgi:hypothetical protein